ncbi:hypothetical protein ABPG74_007787 [Tetrahymena malaccensis]
MINHFESMNDFQNNQSIAKLSQLNKIYIKKSVVEVSGCNKYNIYGIHEFISESEYNTQAIFYIAEYSDFCNRQFCPRDCRYFKLLVSNSQTSEKNQLFEKNTFLEFDRTKKCTFCCFQRPEICINFKTSTSTFYMGKVVVPFNLFNSSYQLDAYDSNNDLKYTMKESCYSCNICCGGCKCKKTCKEQYFRIYDHNTQEFSNVQSISYNFQKSCLKAIYDKIHEFPQNASSQDKILLICTIIMYDMTFFEADCRRR